MFVCRKKPRPDGRGSIKTGEPRPQEVDFRSLPLIFALLPFLTLNLSGGEIRREGAYWVQTIEGSEPAAACTRLRVVAPGNIVFRGGSGDALSYVCKLRFVPPSAEQAERLLRRCRRERRGAGRRQFHHDVRRGGVFRATGFRTAPSRGSCADHTRRQCGRIRSAGGAAGRGRGGEGHDQSYFAATSTSEPPAAELRSGRSVAGFNASREAATSRPSASAAAPSSNRAAGDILIRQVDGALRASTAGGGIHVVNAGDTVIANTAGGPIQIDRAHGSVTARNSGGPIQIGYAASVNCESASGTIQVKSASGSMRASTAVGSIIASYLSGRPALDSFLSTGSGDITVWIPSHLSVTIRARNEASGNVRTIVSDFAGIGVRSEGAAVVAEGRINGGGPVLRLAGNGGMIFIRKGQ